MRPVFLTMTIVMTAAWLAGCAQNPMAVSGPEATLPEKEDSAAYLDRMSSRTEISENDAMRGIIFLIDGEDATATFGDRVKALQSRKIVDETWDFVAERPLTRGRYAYMVYQACGFNGGVMLSVTGPSRRYCLRELQYRKLFPEGSMDAAVGGMEFVGVLGRSDAYIRTGKLPDLTGSVQN